MDCVPPKAKRAADCFKKSRRPGVGMVVLRLGFISRFGRRGTRSSGLGIRDPGFGIWDSGNGVLNLECGIAPTTNVGPKSLRPTAGAQRRWAGAERCSAPQPAGWDSAAHRRRTRENPNYSSNRDSSWEAPIKTQDLHRRRSHPHHHYRPHYRCHRYRHYHLRHRYRPYHRNLHSHRRLELDWQAHQERFPVSPEP